MRLSTLPLFLLCASLAPAQEKLLDRFAPKAVPHPAGTTTVGAAAQPVPAPPDDPTASLKARGIVFVSAIPQLRSGGIGAFDGVRIEGVAMLDNDAFRARIAPYLGKPVSMLLVQAISQETINYYTEQDRPVMRVTAPEQDVTSGVIQFLVTEGHVGGVQVEGNRWFKSNLFTTRLQAGDPILKSRLDADVAWLNRNPFRRVNAELAPGKEGGTTDITLRVQDKLPLRVYAGYEDSGVESTGENRVFGGFNWGNVFGLGHQMGYQFTTSTEGVDVLQAHSLNYSIALPWRHELSFLGTYALSNPQIGDDFDLEGETWQISARYLIPLPSIKKYDHELTLGYDFKSSNNNLQFGGLEVFDTPVEISQFSLAYSGSLPDKLGKTTLSAAGFWSPGDMSTHNDDESFDAARTGSESDYFYATLGLDRITRLPLGLTWSLSAKGQIANGNLQATEQFLLGGYATVRGYDELIASGDSGLLVRNEIYAPPFSIGKLVGTPKLNDRLQFLAFHDYGYAEVSDTLVGEEGSRSLQSAGLGLRWQIRENVSFRFEYGWQIEDLGYGEQGGRAHMGVMVSF